MGRVFGAKAVRRRQVPCPEDFSRVNWTLPRQLMASSAIIGLLFFGSVVTGSPSRRSDVDCVVLHKGEYEDVKPTLARVGQQLWEQEHIPFARVLVSTTEGPRGNHTVREGLRLHLQEVLRKHPAALVGENPLPFIGVDDSLSAQTRLRQDGLDYLTREVIEASKKWEEGWSTLNGNERLDVLGKALARPVHAARRCLELTNPEAALYSKARVLTEVQRHFPQVYDDLVCLVALCREYDEALERHLRSYDERGYQCLLTKLELAVPLARHIATVLRVSLPS